MNEALRDELLAMRDEDEQVRAELAADGSLFDGYNPRMEEVHRANAARLRAIIARHGWPGRSLVGEEGSAAAFLIVQHSIGEPDFMRASLQLLRSAAAAGEADPIAVAMLEDRIRDYEGRNQLYGTQFDWDEHGDMSPKPIADHANVDARRAAVGLPPLAEAVAAMRSRIADAGDKPPADPAALHRDYLQWLIRVGWRKHNGPGYPGR